MKLSNVSNKGMSFVDLLIVVTVAMGLTITTVSLFNTVFKSSSKVDFSETLFEKVNENLIDINSKTLDEIPLVDECLVRLYETSGKFLSESKISVASTNCTDHATDGYKVVWKVSEPANYTFSSTFLKLPKISGGVRQIQIVGSAKVDDFHKIISTSVIKEKK